MGVPFSPAELERFHSAARGASNRRQKWYWISNRKKRGDSITIGRHWLKNGPLLSLCWRLLFSFVTLKRSNARRKLPYRTGKERLRRTFQFKTCSERLPPPGLPRGVVPTSSGP